MKAFTKVKTIFDILVDTTFDNLNLILRHKKTSRGELYREDGHTTENMTIQNLDGSFFTLKIAVLKQFCVVRGRGIPNETVSTRWFAQVTLFRPIMTALK